MSRLEQDRNEAAANARGLADAAARARRAPPAEVEPVRCAECPATCQPALTSMLGFIRASDGTWVCCDAHARLVDRARAGANLPKLSWTRSAAPAAPPPKPVPGAPVVREVVAHCARGGCGAVMRLHQTKSPADGTWSPDFGGVLRLAGWLQTGHCGGHCAAIDAQHARLDSALRTPVAVTQIPDVSYQHHLARSRAAAGLPKITGFPEGTQPATRPRAR